MQGIERRSVGSPSPRTAKNEEGKTAITSIVPEHITIAQSRRRTGNPADLALSRLAATPEGQAALSKAISSHNARQPQKRYVRVSTCPRCNRWAEKTGTTENGEQEVYFCAPCNHIFTASAAPRQIRRPATVTNPRGVTTA